MIPKRAPISVKVSAPRQLGNIDAFHERTAMLLAMVQPTFVVIENASIAAGSREDLLTTMKSYAGKADLVPDITWRNRTVDTVSKIVEMYLKHGIGRILVNPPGEISAKVYKGPYSPQALMTLVRNMGAVDVGVRLHTAGRDWIEREVTPAHKRYINMHTMVAELHQADFGITDALSSDNIYARLCAMTEARGLTSRIYPAVCPPANRNVMGAIEMIRTVNLGLRLLKRQEEAHKGLHVLGENTEVVLEYASSVDANL